MIAASIVSTVWSREFMSSAFQTTPTGCTAAVTPGVRLRRGIRPLTRATATEITVRSGEEIAGIDIRHREERGHTISGTVSGDTAGQGHEGIMIMLMSGADRQLAGMTGMIGSKGFAMFGVTDGEYEIAAVRMNSHTIRICKLGAPPRGRERRRCSGTGTENGAARFDLREGEDRNLRAVGGAPEREKVPAKTDQRQRIGR